MRAFEHFEDAKFEEGWLTKTICLVDFHQNILGGDLADKPPGVLRSSEMNAKEIKHTR
jgi:hypothetical protein